MNRKPVKKNKSAHGISRRHFMKAAGVSVGAAALGSGPLFLTSAQAAERRWDQEADVVVVGYGGAGATAAIAALDAGAEVVILEKRGARGGTTVLSGGVMHAAASSVQREHGIEDEPEKMYQHFLNAGKGMNDPELVRIVCEESAKAVDWLIELGAEFRRAPTVGGLEVLVGSEPIARVHSVSYGALDGGPAFFTVLADAAEERGAEILMETIGKRLVVNEAGEVLGIVAEKDGQDLMIKARKAVVLTTGGFTRSIEMLAAFNRQGFYSQPLTPPALTGDGHRMAFALGADAANMSLVLGIPGLTFPGAVRASYGPNLGILVNARGERFVDEFSFYDWKNKELLCQPGGYAFVVFDEALRAEVGRIGADFTEDLREEIADGVVLSAETLAELAEQMDVPGGKLGDTITHWNAEVEVGLDSRFDRTVNLKPIATAPFYAVKLFSTMFDTKGGVKINHAAQVVNVWGEAIPRLYAAGQVSGGVIGEYYPGSGTALTVFLVFGRIAGRQAAQETAWH